MDGWMDGWMDGRTDRHTYISIDKNVLKKIKKKINHKEKQPSLTNGFNFVQAKEWGLLIQGSCVGVLKRTIERVHG